MKGQTERKQKILVFKISLPINLEANALRNNENLE
jgi:hypothetical protein